MDNLIGLFHSRQLHGPYPWTMIQILAAEVLLVIFSVITFATNKKRSCEFPMAQQVQVFTTCYCPPPQHESLRRIGISKQLKCATIPSLSVSASSVLRNASFCCSSTPTSSVHCNLPSSPKIFVKGLPLSTSEGRLMKVFSEFGEVTLVQVPIDKESGQSLGFAYIWFVKEESAQLAVQEMNGKFFDGRFIYVTIAKPGSSKSSKRTTSYKF